jgi:hypothetical protein
MTPASTAWVRRCTHHLHELRRRRPQRAFRALKVPMDRAFRSAASGHIIALQIVPHHPKITSDHLQSYTSVLGRPVARRSALRPDYVESPAHGRSESAAPVRFIGNKVHALARIALSKTARSGRSEYQRIARGSGRRGDRPSAGCARTSLGTVVSIRRRPGGQVVNNP